VREDAALVRQARLEGFAALNLAWTRLLDGDPTDGACWPVRLPTG
jgi:hypothetical protein